MHSVAQEKAREEAIQMNGKESETMKYIEAVIKESLRLYPIVPAFSRLVVEPVEIGKHLSCFLFLIELSLFLSSKYRRPNVSRWLFDWRSSILGSS